MAKRSIGITINRDRMDIVQIVKDRDSYRLEKTHTAPLRRESDNPAEILKTLSAEKIFDRKAPVALALPASALSYRHIDQNKAQQRCEQSNADWLDEFPHSAETIVTEGCAYQQLPDRQPTYLMAATDRNTILQHSEPLRQVGWNLQRIDAPILALHTLALTNHPDQTTEPAIILFAGIDHLDILIFQGTEAITIRSLPWNNSPGDSSLPLEELLISELEMSWRMAFNETISPSTSIIIAGLITTDTTLLQTVAENLLADVIHLNSTAHLILRDDENPPDDLCLAQGLALRGLTLQSGQGMNFQNTQAYMQTQNPTSLRKPALTSLILLCAIVLTTLTLLLTQRYSLESHYTHLKTQIRTHFQECLPHETNIVNENAQLQTHLTSLEQTARQLGISQKTSRTPLDIMSLINEQSPATLGIVIDQLRINAQTILIEAHGAKPEHIQTWQKQLEQIKGFNKVQQQGATNKTTQGTLHFTLKITLAEVTP